MKKSKLIKNLTNEISDLAILNYKLGLATAFKHKDQISLLKKEINIVLDIISLLLQDIELELRMKSVLRQH